MLAAFVHSDALCSGFACLMSCRYLASSGRPHSYRLNPLNVREKCAQSPERIGIPYRILKADARPKNLAKAKRASYFKSGNLPVFKCDTSVGFGNRTKAPLSRPLVRE